MDQKKFLVLILHCFLMGKKNRSSEAMAGNMNGTCELLPHPPYTPDLAPSDYWLFADLKKMFAGNKFRTNEEVIAESEAYFEAKDKSFYKSGIEMLERRGNACVALDRDYVDE